MSPENRWLIVILSAVALVAALSATSTEPAPEAAVVTSASASEARASVEEYVVRFEAGVEAAEQSIAQAGGTVVDVNPQIGAALVRSSRDGFVDDVRTASGVRGVAFNHAVGLARPDMPHLFAPEGPTLAERRRAAASARGLDHGQASEAGRAGPAAEPLAGRQWNMAMIGATADKAHRQVTGAGVDIGIIDTGIDARHPDVAPNLDRGRSRNFTVDRPQLDGPCEVASCVDPPDVDGKGHGTHVAGIVAGARNGFGLVGVAPDARLVSLRAGQDSGYFFLYETVDALVAAGDLGLDVVNMSFYTDPWLYNCDSRDDYISGTPTDDDLAQQRLARELVVDALEYAHSRSVTLVAASGNEHTDLAAPHRDDPFVPPDAAGRPRHRTVSRDCINLPSEGPHVISVGAVGPSGTKADYSNWGHPSVTLVAPGGWIRDRLGTPHYDSPGNLILSSYPQDAAIAQNLANANGEPTDPFSVRWCAASGSPCGFYTYLQGTSMAAPHVTGVAALVIQREGVGNRLSGYSLKPDRVASILRAMAVDQPCPPGGVEDYTAEGRGADWNARCVGTTAVNSLYGEGIVSAEPGKG